MYWIYCNFDKVIRRSKVISKIKQNKPVSLFADYRLAYFGFYYKTIVELFWTHFAPIKQTIKQIYIH